MRTLTMNENVVKSLLCVAQDKTDRKSSIGLLFRDNDTIAVSLNEHYGIFIQSFDVVQELVGKSIKLPVIPLAQFSGSRNISIVFDFDSDDKGFVIENSDSVCSKIKIEESGFDYNNYLSFCKFNPDDLQPCNYFRLNPSQFSTFSKIGKLMCGKNKETPTFVHVNDSKPMVVVYDNPCIIGLVMPFIFDKEQYQSPSWI